jgi:ferredoxin-thioredoxin reductase catalytic subunit
MTPEQERLKNNLRLRGYYFNPDTSMTDALLESLLVNEQRYGYPFCPCRLATKDRARDLDAVCPCNVRDLDIFEYGMCYCGLYVSREVSMNATPIQPIPERRGTPPAANQIWRCQVCGYICVRPVPPDVCPVCGVTRDRFETITL